MVDNVPTGKLEPAFSARVGELRMMLVGAWFTGNTLIVTGMDPVHIEVGAVSQMR
jgi:hypothetical protein